MTIRRPLGNAHPAYERAAEERAVRGLIFEIASVRATFEAAILGELVEGWNDEAHAIVARYFGENRGSCLGCGMAAASAAYPASAWVHRQGKRGENYAWVGEVSRHTDICADCAASTYRDAFLDAIAERAGVTL